MTALWSAPQNDPQVWTSLAAADPRASGPPPPCVCCGRGRPPKAVYCTSCRRELDRAGVRANRYPCKSEGR